MTKQIDVVDFFSGCGGTSSGMSAAGLNILAGIDNDADSARTFALNFPESTFFLKDVRDMDVFELNSVLQERSTDRPLLFAGCAPCQPFSRQNKNASARDPRRSLLNEFTRFVKTWLPDFILIENVPGLQRTSAAGPFATFKRALQTLEYQFDTAVVAASSFGVPQTRERLILMASRIGPISIPDATHGPGLAPYSTVLDWISGLSPIDAGRVDANDADHAAAALSELNLRRIMATPEGGDRRSWPADLWLDCHKEFSGHTDVYGRLSWTKPAAGLTTRCISYSNGRFGHPDQNRAISVREAACLQTFPRSYRFCGSLQSKARQIGNAVPPLMAQAIGRQFNQSARLHRKAA